MVSVRGWPDLGINLELAADKVGDVDVALLCYKAGSALTVSVSESCVFLATGRYKKSRARPWFEDLSQKSEQEHTRAQLPANMPASLRIELFPSSLEKFIDFYSNVLRFTLIKHVDDYAYLQRDNIFIGAIETISDENLQQKGSYRQPRKGVEIVLEVDQLENERDHIVEKGWKLDEDIHMQPWGLQDFRLIDPDGYYLRITTPSPSRDGTKL